MNPAHLEFCSDLDQRDPSVSPARALVQIFDASPSAASESRSLETTAKALLDRFSIP